MQRPTPIRSLATLTIVLGTSLLAPAQLEPLQATPQSANPSALPATLPTTQPAPQPTEQGPAPLPVNRADVTYTNGQLSVSANNSSLNQILREVSRHTGMKITGGVTDEHVFGTYGPAPPAQILANLLDGTGSNMLLVQNGAAAPTELILTPRLGGVTPPNPNAPGFNDASDEDNAPIPVERVIIRNPRQNTQPGQPDPNRPDPQPAFLPTSTPPSTTPDATQDQSPNGVKTPQQIYDQLMHLRQQSQQQQPAPQ